MVGAQGGCHSGIGAPNPESIQVGIQFMLAGWDRGRIGDGPREIHHPEGDDYHGGPADWACDRFAALFLRSKEFPRHPIPAAPIGKFAGRVMARNSVPGTGGERSRRPIDPGDYAVRSKLDAQWGDGQQSVSQRRAERSRGGVNRDAARSYGTGMRGGELRRVEFAGAGHVQRSGDGAWRPDGDCLCGGRGRQEGNDDEIWGAGPGDGAGNGRARATAPGGGGSFRDGRRDELRLRRRGAAGGGGPGRADEKLQLQHDGVTRRFFLT